MNRTKKLLSLALALVFCVLTFSVTVFAATGDDGVAPCYDNISTATIDLAFFDGEGLATASATRQIGTTKMVGIVDIYVKNSSGEWDFVTSWSKESTRASLAISGEFTAVRGRTYKAVFTITAIDDTYVETDVLSVQRTYN